MRVRVGDHAAHGRIVFDFPRETSYRLEQQEDRLVLRFATPAEFDLGARRPVRNVRDIESTEGGAAITLVPGSRVRHFRLGGRIVVDVLDPDGAATTQFARAAPAAPRQDLPRPAGRPRPAPTAEPPQPPPPAPAPVAIAQPAPPPSAPAPAPTPVVAAAPLPPSRGTPLRMADGALLVPAAADVGAALLRRGETWLLVLDAPLTLDAGPLRDGPLSGTEISAGPRATVLRLPAVAMAEPLLTRRPAGWLLENGTTAPVFRTIRPELEPGPPPRLLLRAAKPAETVVVLDTESGGALLVGTVREGGEATPVGRRAATFEVLPTRLGAAILPRADTVTLRALPNGFVASPGPGAALALGTEPPAEGDATGMTRLFDLPNEPLAGLIQRERNANLAIGGAPPLGRGQPRLRAAEALLALGMGAEAQAMAALAMREDPRLAEDPRARALHGAAALVSGRLAEADGLLNPRLADTDEGILWRGLLAAARDGEGAADIAPTLPLLRAYPEPLRLRLAPLAAEALAAGGETQAARRLLAGQEEERAFALARARLLDAAADPGALEAYEAISRGRDRRARAIAMRRVVDLRLAAGSLDAAGAAAAMEAVLVAWRGDALESGARIRLAELRRQAGDPRGAFETLREAEQLFPALAPTLRGLQAEALLAALADGDPLSAVALFDAHAALLPPDVRSAEVLAALAERFAALDLTDRARRVMAQALARADRPELRGRIGLRQAQLALDARDFAGARAALADTQAADLPVALEQARRLVEARALSRMDAIEQAIAAYREAGSEAAPEHAEFLASRQNWAPAAAVLRDHLSATLPPAPATLPEDARRLLARFAALLALAGDQEGLAALRTSEGPRMEGGPHAEAFALMTAPRMLGMADLRRLPQELDQARALRGQPDAMRPMAAPAR